MTDQPETPITDGEEADLENEAAALADDTSPSAEHVDEPNGTEEAS